MLSSLLLPDQCTWAIHTLHGGRIQLVSHTHRPEQSQQWYDDCGRLHVVHHRLQEPGPAAYLIEYDIHHAGQPSAGKKRNEQEAVFPPGDWTPTILLADQLVQLT